MISFNNGEKKKLSEHFNTYEFRCKCGKKHICYVDQELIDLLEKTRKELEADACIIYSGYRCSEHDIKVGGKGKPSRSHAGYAVDCYFTKNGKRINSKNVVLKLEDLGHNKGIGYRCGGSQPSTGQTHIDTKNRKWYGDESKSMDVSCCSSFYEYLGVKKPEPTPTPTPTPTPEPTEIKYIIKRGDTLTSIAKQYGTTWKNIYELNKQVIDSTAKKHGQVTKFYNHIYPGTELRIK